MGTPQTNQPPAGPDAKSDVKQMTAAEAAKQVKRPVVTREAAGQDRAGKDLVKVTTKLVAVRAEEVLDFKDYGSHVVVVTEDGQKFASNSDVKAGEELISA